MFLWLGLAVALLSGSVIGRSVPRKKFIADMDCEKWKLSGFGPDKPTVCYFFDTTPNLQLPSKVNQVETLKGKGLQFSGHRAFELKEWAASSCTVSPGSCDQGFTISVLFRVDGLKDVGTILQSVSYDTTEDQWWQIHMEYDKLAVSIVTDRTETTYYTIEKQLYQDYYHRVTITLMPDKRVFRVSFDRFGFLDELYEAEYDRGENKEKKILIGDDEMNLHITIDEILVFDKALSPEQLWALRRGDPGQFPSWPGGQHPSVYQTFDFIGAVRVTEVPAPGEVNQVQTPKGLGYRVYRISDGFSIGSWKDLACVHSPGDCKYGFTLSVLFKLNDRGVRGNLLQIDHRQFIRLGVDESNKVFVNMATDKHSCNEVFGDMHALQLNRWYRLTVWMESDKRRMHMTITGHRTQDWALNGGRVVGRDRRESVRVGGQGLRYTVEEVITWDKAITETGARYLEHFD